MARKSRKFKRRGGYKKTKRGRRSLKRKTMRRKNKRKSRKTRKRRGGKTQKIDIASLNAAMDNKLNVALKDLKSHRNPISPGIIYDAFTIRAKTIKYPLAPPVVKKFGFTNKKKTDEAKNMWHQGLQNQKQKLEELFHGAFEGEKAYREYKKKFSMAEKPTSETVGSPDLTDVILSSLDQTYKRLEIQNNLRTKVNQWRQNNP